LLLLCLQINTTGFGGQMSKIMRNKLEPLVLKFRNNEEIISRLAVIWAHSGKKADNYSASLVRALSSWVFYLLQTSLCFLQNVI
jgi:hypothetical protein